LIVLTGIGHRQQSADTAAQVQAPGIGPLQNTSPSGV
jgi:hypothetical protein